MKFPSQLRSIALIGLLGALLFGCGSTGKDGGPGGDPYSAAPRQTLDRTYVVTGVTEDGKKRALVPGSEIRLSFKDGRLGITAGCNSMGASYRLEGTRLTVDGLATTEMGCDQPLMDQDTWVAGLFAGPVQFRTGDDAALISGDVVLALVDREQASPDKPLTRTIWVLDSIGTSGPDGAVSSVPSGVVGYVVFSGDSAGLYDGCNEGSAPATVDGSEITFGDRTSTLRGCSGDGVEEVQQAFSDVLAGTAAFEIEENRLTLTNGDRTLGFRAAEKLPQHD